MGEIRLIDNPLLHKTGIDEDRLTTMLKYIDNLPMYVGAQNWGEDETPIILTANFILRRFKSIQPNQLIEAFEMAAAGELYQDGKRVKVTTYGKTLDIDVIGTVLSAYKAHLQEKARQPKYIDPAKLIEAPGAVKPTGELYYNIMVKDITETGKLAKVMNWEKIHAYMVEKGYLDEINPKKVKITRAKNTIQTIGDQFELDPYRMDIYKYLVMEGVIDIEDDPGQ